MTKKTTNIILIAAAGLAAVYLFTRSSSSAVQPGATVAPPAPALPPLAQISPGSTVNSIASMFPQLAATPPAVAVTPTPVTAIDYGPPPSTAAVQLQ